MKNPIYIGDGVYARFDGYQVWFAVDNHLNEVVALEPRVIEALNKFYEYAKENFKPEEDGK